MIRCTIEAERSKGLVHMVAYAQSDAPEEVESRLFVSKSGPAGMSTNEQGGTYSLRAGRKAVVGEVTLGAEEGDEVKALLDLRARSGTARCRYPQD